MPLHSPIVITKDWENSFFISRFFSSDHTKTTCLAPNSSTVPLGEAMWRRDCMTSYTIRCVQMLQDCLKMKKVSSSQTYKLTVHFCWQQTMSIEYTISIQEITPPSLSELLSAKIFAFASSQDLTSKAIPKDPKVKGLSESFKSKKNILGRIASGRFHGRKAYYVY